MVIYSNNLAEKLFGYAISRDYIKYSSPFCDLLDDPNLSLDFDLAINFNKAINGDGRAANEFTEQFILNGPSLDVSTINFYVKKMNQYPIMHHQIERVYYIFGNVEALARQNSIQGLNNNDTSFASKLLDALKDCLNSPCNYFDENSNSVGKLAEATANTNNGTMPPFKELFGEITTAIGGMGKDIFNRIPAAFQNGIIELSALGQGAFSEISSIFTSDNKDELIKKAKGKISLRGGTTAEGNILTPDFKSYLDATSASTKILEKVAGQMGDCFRQYEQSYRYNPYDPSMNLDTSNVSEVADQANGQTQSRDLTGQVSTERGTRTSNSSILGTSEASQGTGDEKYNSDSEGSGIIEPSEMSGEVAMEFTVGEPFVNENGITTTMLNRVTYFGGWYDDADPNSRSSKTVWSDGYGAPKSNTGTAGDLYTQKGIGWVGQEVRYCPSYPMSFNEKSIEGSGYLKELADGWISSDRIDKISAASEKKYNHGVAITTKDIKRYFGGNSSNLKNYVAELTYNGKTLSNVNIVDNGGGAPNSQRDGVVRLDMTPYILYKLTGVRPDIMPGQEDIYNKLPDGTEVKHARLSQSFPKSVNGLKGLKVRIIRKGVAASKSSGGAYKVFNTARNEVPGGWSAFRKNYQVISLDFNGVQGSPDMTGRGYALVCYGGGNIPSNIAPILTDYTEKVAAFFNRHGYKHITTKDGKYPAKSPTSDGMFRIIHTEPFFGSDREAVRIIKTHMQEYTTILKTTLGTIPKAAFIPPHNAPGKPGIGRPGQGAQLKWNDRFVSEFEFAKTDIIPKL